MVDAARILDRMTQMTPLAQRRAQPLILELDLTEGLHEGPPSDPVSALLGMRRPRLQDVLDGLRRAASDDRVKGLVAKVGGRHIGFGAVQELRAAVTEFRRAGKGTLAWSETFGEFGPGTVPYYLATAFERIALQPSGDVGVTGVAIEERFLRGTLEKLDVKWEVGQRYEYKTAVNTFTQDSLTEAHREADERLIASLGEQIVSGIAEGRGKSADDVRALIDRAPLLGAEALEAGLVDRLAYRDEIYDELRESVEGDPRLQYVARYNRAHALGSRIPKPREQVVALVRVTGGIRLGRSGRGPMSGGGNAGSDTVAGALRAAIKDDKVSAIVLRVNSPGGSYVASDVIWREVVRAGAVGKPVVVSMGDMAASGGYFVAMGADTIVAQPGTLTGSIGVFGGKPVLGDLLGRLGVTFDTLRQGARAGMFSTSTPFTDDEWDRVNTWLDHVYTDFTAKAAQGRDLTRDRVHELARGRVWTGADAHENGLVDLLGGLDLAAGVARKKAGLSADAPLRPYPHVSPIDRLRPPESSEDRTAARTALRLEMWGPLADLSARAGLPLGGPLMLPVKYEVR
ncbi:MAG TPA: signal peptide peptidase SppA [Streptosporangiaceae bacterium]|jgi:protease-4